MSVGLSAFLIAIGVILAFASDVVVAGVDLAVGGIVLVIAGVLGLVLDLVVLAPRRRGSGARGYRSARTIVHR